MTQRLKQFLDDALDGKNVIINEISNDPYYKHQIEVMVKDMTFTKQSFEPNMKEIASLVLKRSTNYRYVIPLLLFGIHLDKYHSTYSTWYRRTLLVDILYEICVEQHNKKYYYWSGTFILLIGSIIFIILE